MKWSLLTAVIIAAAFGGLGWWLRTYHFAGVSTLVTLGAVAIATFAGFQAARSAHASSKTSALALKNEERAKYGWTITVHPEGDRYVLRNMGTLTAHDVRFINVDPHTFIQFEQHEGERGPTIERGHAVAFQATFTFGSSGNAVELDWQPEGEKTRRTFKDVLDEIPNKFSEETTKRWQTERDAEAAMNRVWCAEIRKILIELAGAWGDFKAKDTPQTRSRVQGLVSALPSNMVRAMGNAVDVPRDFWGEHQWPFENWVQERKDKQLVRENAPMIELMWNLTWVQIPRVRGGDLSQPPDPWHRLEHAIHGYVELVRNRERGKIEFRDGERDRKSTEDAMKMFERFKPMLEGGDPPPGGKRYNPDESPGSGPQPKPE